MFGWTAREAIGRAVDDTIVPANLRAMHRSGFARYLSTGTSSILNRSVELNALRRDGTVFPIELSISRSRLVAR